MDGWMDVGMHVSIYLCLFLSIYLCTQSLPSPLPRKSESRASQGMPSAVYNAKIAIIDFNLQRHKLQLGVQVVVQDMMVVDLIWQWYGGGGGWEG